MSQLSTYLIMAIVFLTLGTFALIGVCIANAIYRGLPETVVYLVCLSVAHLFCGYRFLSLHYRPKESSTDQGNDKDLRDPS